MWDEITYPFLNFNGCFVMLWLDISLYYIHAIYLLYVGRCIILGIYNIFRCFMIIYLIMFLFRRLKQILSSIPIRHELMLICIGFHHSLYLWALKKECAHYPGLVMIFIPVDLNYLLKVDPPAPLIIIRLPPVPEAVLWAWINTNSIC